MIKDTSPTDTVIENRKKPLALKIIITIIISLLLLLAYLGISGWINTDDSYSRERIRTASVSEGTFEHSFTAEGKIVALVESTLFATSEGYVSLLVEPGDIIAKGQVLAKINNLALEAKLKEANSQLEKSKLDLKRFEADIDLQRVQSKLDLKLSRIRNEAAKRKLGRYNSAGAQRSFSAHEYETVQDEALIAKTEYENLASTQQLRLKKFDFEVLSKTEEVRSQEVLTKNLARRVDELTIKSEINGQVGSIYIKEKDALKTSEPIMNVVDLSLYGVELDIAESYANDVSLGMSTVITYEGDTFDGELTSVSAEVKNSGIEAKAKFLTFPNKELRQNQRVTVKVILNSYPDTLVVQRGPFIDSTAGRVAYVINGDIAEAKSIEIGAMSSSQVEIKSGLKAGDQIIISDTSAFSNAKRVLLH